jgi:ribosomal protein L16 Arg81 hydroxylase
VPSTTVDLEAGDLLFLPFGWAHFVECRANAFTYNYWLNPKEAPFFKRAESRPREEGSGAVRQL